MSIVAANVILERVSLRLELLLVGETETISAEELAIPHAPVALLKIDATEDQMLLGLEREKDLLASIGKSVVQVAAEYELLHGASPSLTFPEMLPPLMASPGVDERPVLLCGRTERLLGGVPSVDGTHFVALDFLARDSSAVSNDATTVMFDPDRPLDKQAAARVLTAAHPIRQFMEQTYGTPGVTFGIQLVDDYKNQWASAAPQYKRSLIKENTLDELTLARYASSLWIGCGVGLIGSESSEIITAFGAAVAIAYLVDAGRASTAALASKAFGDNPRASEEFRAVFATISALCESTRGRRELQGLVRAHWGDTVGATEFLRDVERLRSAGGR